MGRKLLVADDSATIQKVIKLALSSETYEISTVSTGQDLLSLLETESPEVVLLDVTLPDMNAYDIKFQINKNPKIKNIKFILMYSAFEKVDEKQASLAVFDGRLIKPFDPSNLRKLISDLLTAKTEDQHPRISNNSQEDISVPIQFNAKERTGDVMTSRVGKIFPQKTKEEQIAAPPVLPLMMETAEPVITELPVINKVEEITETAPPAFLQTEFISDDMAPIQSEMEVIEEIPTHDKVNTSEFPLLQDNDIRNLTDSTMQVIDNEFSGWSIDEKSKMRTEAPAKSESPTRFVEIPTKPFDDEMAPLQIPKPTKPAAASTSFTPPQPQQNVFPSQGLSTKELIEEVIRKDLKSNLEPAIERIIRETVSGLAEKLIKKEIDKMLSDQ